jgi:hypothetical protein
MTERAFLPAQITLPSRVIIAEADIHTWNAAILFRCHLGSACILTIGVLDDLTVPRTALILGRQRLRNAGVVLPAGPPIADERRVDIA